MYYINNVLNDVWLDKCASWNTYSLTKQSKRKKNLSKMQEWQMKMRFCIITLTSSTPKIISSLWLAPTSHQILSKSITEFQRDTRKQAGYVAILSRITSVQLVTGIWYTDLSDQCKWGYQQRWRNVCSNGPFLQRDVSVGTRQITV